MATQPKPKPKPEPKPDDDDAAHHYGHDAANHGRAEEPPGITLLERVENLENRMTALEERVAAPPVGIGRRS
jgi:hypothetical protein